MTPSLYQRAESGKRKTQAATRKVVNTEDGWRMSLSLTPGSWAFSRQGKSLMCTHNQTHREVAQQPEEVNEMNDA